MTGMTDYSAKSALNYLTGAKAAPALTGVWLALSAAIGSEASAGFNEVSGNGYARVQVAGSVITSSATTTSSSTINHAAVPSWVAAGMQARDAVTGNVIGVVQSVGPAAVNLTAPAIAAVASGAGIIYSAFHDATGSSPVSTSNGAHVSFPMSESTGWGTITAWGLTNAPAGGDLTFVGELTPESQAVPGGIAVSFPPASLTIKSE